jgi:cytoskeletal protein CcmA (bactofilin family)
MVNKTKSVLVSGVKIKGNITEKESIIIDGEVNGNINAKLVETFENSNVEGNITSKNTFIGGKLKGDINSDSVHIRKTADVDGTIKQKTLSIEEGSLLTIKTEIKK